MNSILFIGSYLSKKRGSKSIAEKLKDLVKTDFPIKLCSRHDNKFLRLLDIIYATISFKGNKIIVDTYSGQAFFIAEVVSILARLRNKRLILVLRGGKLAEFDIAMPQKISKVFNRAHSIYSPSLYLKDYFAQKGIQVNYLPNGVDLNRFHFKRDRVNDYSLLWVRAFNNIYNPDLAVKVLYEVKKEFSNSTLTMVGPDNGVLNETLKLIDSLGLKSSIKIVGSVPNGELFEYYQSHAVYLNTTSYESFGVALIEAASCGIPIVSTRVGEIPYIWKDNFDILLTSFDSTLFASRVIEVLKNKELAFILSNNANIVAQKFNWSNVNEQWNQLLAN